MSRKRPFKVIGGQTLLDPLKTEAASHNYRRRLLDFAPQVGLEPTTYGLTVRRSNQLSY